MLIHACYNIMMNMQHPQDKMEASITSALCPLFTSYINFIKDTNRILSGKKFAHFVAACVFKS
jgi:hypothetical protein